MALVNAYRDNELTQARQIFASMLPILTMQTVYRCSLTKEVLLQRGLVQSAHVRAPGPKMDEKDKKELHACWELVEDFMGPLSAA